MEQKINLDILLENIYGIAYRCLNDKDWTMEFITSGIERITGYTAEEILYNSEVSFDDLYLEEDKEPTRIIVDKALENKEFYTIEYRIRHKNGNIIHLWEQGVGVYDGDEIVALEGYICDITAQKQTEEDLKRKVEEQAAELLKKKEEEIEQANFRRILELTKAMAHELKNPLTLNINSCFLLEDEIALKENGDNKKIHRLLTILRDANNRIQEIVETIESTFRSVTKKRSNHKLSDLFRRAITIHKKTELEKYNITLDLQDSIKNYNLKITQESFVQSIKNLLRNSIAALKNTDKRKRKISISTIEQSNSNKLLIRIFDNGVGISKEAIDKITLPFYSSLSKSKGGGLGLSATKFLLQDDNLDIAFESKKNEWTEVTISIPSKYWSKNE